MYICAISGTEIGKQMNAHTTYTNIVSNCAVTE